MQQFTVRISGGEEQENQTQKVFEEIMTENSPHFLKNTHIHVQEAEQIPNKIHPKKSM